MSRPAIPTVDWPLTAAELDAALASAAGPVVAVRFRGNGGERAFTAADAVIAHRLTNLPDAERRLPVAHLSGMLRGADLALALFCPVLVLDADASLLSGFERPGAAAVYVAASRRIGTAACERLLFGRHPASGGEAVAALVATAGAGETWVGTVGARAATLLSVARANLVTWPLASAALQALVDGRDAQPACREPETSVDG